MFAVFDSTAPAPIGPQREAPRSHRTGFQAILTKKVQVPSVASGRSSSGSLRDGRFLFKHPKQSGLRQLGDAELFSELTKPAYLHVRLLATPTNHRAPPA